MFSGIGGFELGIHNAYLRCLQPENNVVKQDSNNSKDKLQQRKLPNCVGYSEIDKYAIATYQQHFGGHRNYGDATKINAAELPDFDLLVGGFPCQAFSVAGKRLGFNDTRGTLFFDIARILSEKRPRHLVLENVKGLLSHDGGKTFQTIIGVLTDLGYFVEWQVLNSKDFGVPQNRERVFIVGHLGGAPRRKVFPLFGTDGQDFEPGQTSTTINSGGGGQGAKTGLYAVRQPLRFLNRNQKNIEGDYSYTVDASQTSGVRQETRIRRLTPLVSPTLNTMQGGRRQPFVMKKIDRSTQTYEIKDTETAGTLTSTMWKGINALGRTGVKELPRIRRLTPLECERLQGFPDNWTIGSDTQRYKQCGNAVTVNVVEAVMTKLLGE